MVVSKIMEFGWGPSNYKLSLRWHSSGQYPWKSIYGGDGMQTEVDFRDMSV